MEGFRPRSLFLFLMGGRRFSAARLFCGHTGCECAVRRSYRLLRENRSAGVSRRFFVCRGRCHRCGCASSGCGRGWPACVMRRVPAPFGRARPCVDALIHKKKRRHSRFGMSPPCGPFGPLSVSVCSQSAVLRRPLLRQKEEKVLQLMFCSAAASTSSGRFAKKSKPVSRSISSTETT